MNKTRKDLNNGNVPMRPKQMKMRTDPEAETTQGEKAESQSQPKRGVATTVSMVELIVWL